MTLQSPTRPRALVAAMILAAASTTAAAQHHDHNHRHDDHRLPVHGPTVPRPLLVMPQLEHNFGEVWYGSEVTHVFKVHNEGDAPLELISVRPSCGCTVAEFDKTIPAHGTGEIKATLSSSGNSNNRLRHRVVLPVPTSPVS